MKREKLKERARELRKEGKSYTEIKTIISVPKSTLSVWLRDVQLSNDQLEGLIRKRTHSARHLAGEALKRKRVNSSFETILNAWKEVNRKANDPLFLLGVSLYWAEGGKTQEIISFSNSDACMIQAIMKWLRKSCGIEEKKFRVQVHIHSLHSRKDVEEYWSMVTNIPLEQFNKTYIKKTSLGYRKNILYEGTCIIRVHDSTLFRKYVGWKLGLLEHLKIISVPKKEKKHFIKEMVEKRNYKLLSLTP